jgi:hypothetical protein
VKPSVFDEYLAVEAAAEDGSCQVDAVHTGLKRFRIVFGSKRLCAVTHAELIEKFR